MEKIGIIGATGIVGRKTLDVIFEKGLQKNELVLFASKRHRIKVQGVVFQVKKLSAKSLFNAGLNYAIFCTKEEISKEYVLSLASLGVKVIDCSSYFRKDYPLIIPEINSDKITGNVICNPNCSTSAGVMALYSLHSKFGLDRVVYTTFQSVSGAGKHALSDLQVKNALKLKKFKKPIKNNIFSSIGSLDKNGYSTEENKMIYETKKILNDNTIKVTATCVRVPISNCHSLSINFTLKKKADLKDLENILKFTQGVVYLDKEITPLDVVNKSDVYITRLRKDNSFKNTFNMFVISDNLRKGASQNAVQVLEKLLAL